MGSPQKKQILFNLRYKIPHFLPAEIDETNIFECFICRELFTELVSDHFKKLVDSKQRIPEKFSFFVLYKSLLGDEALFIPKIENTIKKIEEQFNINSTCKVSDAKNLIELKNGERGNHIILKVEVGRGWYQSPIYLSLLLLFIKALYQNIDRISSTGANFDTLINFSNLIDNTFVGKESILILQRYNKLIFEYIEQSLNKETIDNYTNKPFGYGFLKFMKNFKGEELLQC